MESLLDCSLRALARYLACSAPESDLREALAIVQRLELVQQLWATWQDLLQAAIAYPGATATIARLPPPPLAQQRAVLEAFAAACWRPQLLRLAYSPGPLPQGLASLPLVGQRLLHLELSASSLWQLDAVVSACPQLCCLSLRGCTHLGDASLAALARCTSLRALDLSGLVALTDGAAFHVAHLPQLSALSLAGTAITDRALQLLTYGHKVRAWARAAGSAELPPEVAAWPAAPLEHLQLAGACGVTAAGVAHLEQLPHLQFLDMRSTGIARAALAPVQRRFALQFVQAAVLSSSNAVAAAVVNLDVVPCRCGLGGSSASGDAAGLAGSAGRFTDLTGWEALGLRLLLHYGAAAGLAALLEPHRRPPAWQAAGAAGSWADERASVGIAGGRRIGFRQPRMPRPQGSRQPPQLAGSKRPLPHGYS